MWHGSWNTWRRCKKLAAPVSGNFLKKFHKTYHVSRCSFRRNLYRVAVSRGLSHRVKQAYDIVPLLRTSERSSESWPGLRAGPPLGTRGGQGRGESPFTSSVPAPARPGEPANFDRDQGVHLLSGPGWGAGPASSYLLKRKWKTQSCRGRPPLPSLCWPRYSTQTHWKLSNRSVPGHLKKQTDKTAWWLLIKMAFPTYIPSTRWT